MSERAHYHTFKTNVLHPGDRCDRIENGILLGVPDINYCIGGIEGWIELKSPIEPKRDTTALFGSNHRVSQDQMNWMLRQRRADGRCFFLLSTDVRWLLLSGSFADAINTMTVNRLVEQCRWMTMKPVRDKQNWTHLRQALIIK